MAFSAPPSVHSSDFEASIKGSVKNRATEPTDDFAAAALAAGLNVPDRFKTQARRWLLLIVMSLLGSAAFGPLSSWPTLEPILIREHVFEGPDQKAKLASVFSIATGVGAMSGLAAGMLYDNFGPRWSGAFGLLSSAASMLCMALAVKVTSLNWLLWISYPAVMCFGQVAIQMTYAWYWLLPNNENSVSSVSAAIQVVSDSFVLVAVWLHRDFSFSMASYFLLVACIAAASGIICLWIVPTLDENNANAAAIIKYRHSFLETSSANPDDGLDQITAVTEASYGSFCDGGSSKRSSKGEAGEKTQAISTEQSAGASFLSKLKATLVDIFALWRLNPSVNALFYAYLVCNYEWAMYPQIKMLELYTGLLGPSAAHRLVIAWGGIVPVAGVIGVLCFGKFMDMVGYTQTIAMLIVPAIVNTILFSVHDYGAQVVAQVILASISSTALVISPRFCLHYGPPELFGRLAGVQGTLLGVFQMAGTPASTALIGAFVQGRRGKGNDDTKYLVTIWFWGFLSIAATFALLFHWWYRPLPVMGSVTMGDIRAATCSADADKSRLQKSERVTKEEEVCQNA